MAESKHLAWVLPSDCDPNTWVAITADGFMPSMNYRAAGPLEAVKADVERYYGVEPATAGVWREFDEGWWKYERAEVTDADA